MSFNKKDENKVKEIKELITNLKPDIRIYQEQQDLCQDKAWQDDMYNMMTKCRRYKKACLYISWTQPIRMEELSRARMSLFQLHFMGAFWRSCLALVTQESIYISLDIRGLNIPIPSAIQLSLQSGDVLESSVSRIARLR